MNKNQIQNEKYLSIKNHPAFLNLNYDLIKSIANCLVVKEFKKNSIVYKEGIDIQQSMFFVTEGEFKMTKTIQHNFNFKRSSIIEITLIQKGDTFGIENVTDNFSNLHHYTVYCQSLNGSLFELNFIQLRGILITFHHCTPLSKFFSYPIQQTKNQIYSLRERELTHLYIYQRPFPSITNTILLKNRSLSTQQSYTKKIEQMLKGQNQAIKRNSTEVQLDDDIYNNYIHESILLNFRAIRNNQKKNIILKNEGQYKTIDSYTKEEKKAFIKHEDYRYKMQVLNKLHFKPKNQNLNHYSRYLNFKSIHIDSKLNNYKHL